MMTSHVTCWLCVNCVVFRDAPIRHRPIAINTKNLFCCLAVIYLGSDCYPRTLTYLKDCRVQTKQIRTQKQSYKTHPLLLETEATLMFERMTYVDAYINFISVTCSPCNAKRQSADTNIQIGLYRLSAKRPIIGRCRLLTDY